MVVITLLLFKFLLVLNLFLYNLVGPRPINICCVVVTVNIYTDIAFLEVILYNLLLY